MWCLHFLEEGVRRIVGFTSQSPHMPKHRLHYLLLASALLLGACATSPVPTPGRSATTSALIGDAARPANDMRWVRSELYFGVGDEGDPSKRIDEARWRGFLDREVTPRFPDGLTVFDAYGQWLFRGRPAPERLASKVLVILHEDSPGRDADIEAIRLAWKAETGHQSVLWAKQATFVSF